MTECCSEKYLKTLIGKADLEDALKKLDKLTQEEARMAIAENLRATHVVDERVRGVTERVLSVERLSSPNLIDIGYGALCIISENQLRESNHKWLSPPDPSTNHNIACGTHHKKTATWFFKGRIYQEWRSKGSLLCGSMASVRPVPIFYPLLPDDIISSRLGQEYSLVRRSSALSIHHQLLISLISSTVIEDIKALCDVGQASMAYFYFDFRNANKQSLCDLLPSLLTQLSARSSPCCDNLSRLYSVHDNGRNQPSDSVLTKCLQDMLSLPDQRPIYLIIDALDESPISSGIPSARERVLQLLKELVDLGLPNLHICVTSRPEIDIRNAIEPLSSLRVSLHDQTGQKEDIADYVRSIVYSNSDTNMKRWKKEDKEIVVKTLAKRANGMYVNYFMFVIHFQIVK
jgi:hypothetical protein